MEVLMSSSLRDEIARMVKLFDPEFGTYEELADRILAIPAIAEALADESEARHFPTKADCRFAIIDTKNGGELLASFDIEDNLAAGDTITVPSFTLSR